MSATQILIAHNEDKVLAKVSSAIEQLDYEVMATAKTCSELRAECDKKRPDVIISGLEYPDGDAIKMLIEISEHDPIPAIVITDKDSLRDVERALQDHVMAYLLQPIDVEQIQPTVYLVLRRFEQFEALREENQDLRQSLADRKIVERAKGILMTTSNLSEGDAFRKLQKLASERRTKLVEIAKTVIAAQEAASE